MAVTSLLFLPASCASLQCQSYSQIFISTNRNFNFSRNKICSVSLRSLNELTTPASFPPLVWNIFTWFSGHWIFVFYLRIEFSHQPSFKYYMLRRGFGAACEIWKSSIKGGWARGVGSRRRRGFFSEHIILKLSLKASIHDILLGHPSVKESSIQVTNW